MKESGRGSDSLGDKSDTKESCHTRENGLSPKATKLKHLTIAGEYTQMISKGSIMGLQTRPA